MDMMKLLRPLLQRQLLLNLSRTKFSSTSGNRENENVNTQTKEQVKTVYVKNGPPLEYFLANSTGTNKPQLKIPENTVPYLNTEDLTGTGRKVYFETYGCQMNVNDTEIAWAILQKNGFQKTDNIKESDVVLVMTCAIREGAEQKIWKRLKYFKYMKRHLQKVHRKDMKIGVLGCMAERLKKQILEKEKMVDLVCGPDAYRDLPHMLAVTESGQTSVNVVLSLEETYADVVPVRLNTDSQTAFVSIMRGCDNMCSYCIVPFTRGRERSRPFNSIVDEVKALSDMGVKEVTLLGQNVNSYRDMSSTDHHQVSDKHNTLLAKGFKTVYKPKVGGRRFADLLEKVSEVDPEMRIRFTSPHPKDFPDEVLYLIRDRANICNQLHLPAQSGSTQVLEAMRRGYTREAYIQLVHHIRQILPDVSFTSDFIAGFCGETETDHQQTVSLMELVKYNFAFCFPYSMRGKTHAYHRLEDNVPEDVKSRRHMELVDVFRQGALVLHQAQRGEHQLVLIEGESNTSPSELSGRIDSNTKESKRSSSELSGRNDGNTKVIFPRQDLPVDSNNPTTRQVSTGDYVVVQITGCSSQVLKGIGLYHTTLQDYYTAGLFQRSATV